MSRILFVQRLPLATFYKRRISRIFPVFILFVCVVYGAAGLAGNGPTSNEFWATVLFLRTYVPGHPGIWDTGLPIGHLWSLNVEEHCYIFLSLLTLIAVFRGREARILILAGVAAMAMFYVYARVPAIAPTSFEIRTETAASHLLLSAGYLLLRDRLTPFIKPWMPVVVFLLGVGCYLDGAPWWTTSFLSPVLLAFAVNHLRDTSSGVRIALSVVPLRMMGIWSYSVYLWQQPFFVLKGALDPALACLLAVLTGLVSFYFFENPARTWLNERW